MNWYLGKHSFMGLGRDVKRRFESFFMEIYSLMGTVKQK